MFLPPVLNAGLSILTLKSLLSKNGFLNWIGLALAPYPNLNGPFGCGKALLP